MIIWRDHTNRNWRSQLKTKNIKAAGEDDIYDEMLKVTDHPTLFVIAILLNVAELISTERMENIIFKLPQRKPTF